MAAEELEPLHTRRGILRRRSTWVVIASVIFATAIMLMYLNPDLSWDGSTSDRDGDGIDDDSDVFPDDPTNSGTCHTFVVDNIYVGFGAVCTHALATVSWEDISVELSHENSSVAWDDMDLEEFHLYGRWLSDDPMVLGPFEVKFQAWDSGDDNDEALGCGDYLVFTFVDTFPDEGECTVTIGSKSTGIQLAQFELAETP